MTTQEQELVVYCDSCYHLFANGGFAACAAYFRKQAVVVGSQQVQDSKEADLTAIVVALQYIELYIKRASVAIVFIKSQDTLSRINNRSLPFFQYPQETLISDLLLTLSQNKIRVLFRRIGSTNTNEPNPAEGLAYAHLLDRVNKTTYYLEQYSQLVGESDDISFVDTAVPTAKVHSRLSNRVSVSRGKTQPSRDRVHALVNMFSTLAA